MMRDLSLHLLDILQNSVVADATNIQIELSTNDTGDKLIFKVIDNGKGMTRDMVNRVIDPFVTTRTSRKVGLGIPMIKEACEITGGEFKLCSELNAGTSLTADFVVANIDRLPIGDIADTMVSNILAYPDIDHILTLKSKNGEFIMSTADIKKEMEGVPVSDPNVLMWIKEYIHDGIKNIFGGVLNEVDG